MVFANPAYDVTHNKGAPPLVGSPYESVRKPWSLIGRYHADPVLDVMFAPIGPRTVITVGHIAAGVNAGLPIDMQGKTYHVVSVQLSTKQVIGVPGAGNPGTIYNVDAAYVTVDQDIPEWFRRFKDVDIPNVGLNSLLLNISGGRGGQVSNDSEGWPAAVLDPVYTTSIGNRWSIQRCDYIGRFSNYPPNPAQPDPPPWMSAAAFFRHHDDPQGHPECATAADQDSGSPVFINCGPVGDEWVFLGCVSGGGSAQLSPYKGNVQTGTSCSMCYMDNDTIAAINGEAPPPVEPPPVKPPVAKPKPVIPKPIVIPPRPATAFDTVIMQGMNVMESMCGSIFTLDGDSHGYIGTYNQHAKGQQISPGGYEENIDATIVASKPQFGTVKPRNGQRVTAEGNRYIAAEVIEDSASWTLHLTSINR